MYIMTLLVFIGSHYASFPVNATFKTMDECVKVGVTGGMQEMPPADTDPAKFPAKGFVCSKSIWAK